MHNKKQFIANLRNEFDRWDELLAGISEEQIIAPQPSSNLSIKDVIAHLRAWQQISIARLQAALGDRAPEFPEWVGKLPTDWEREHNTERTNALIYEINRAKPWSSVYRDWREGFLRFLELAEQIPEENYFDPGKYPWLEGYALAAVLEGSYEHHHVDHLEPLIASLREHRNTKTTG